MNKTATKLSTQNCDVGMDEEAESEPEGIERCTITRCNFSMSPQMINQAVGELYHKNYIFSYPHKVSHCIVTIGTLNQKWRRGKVRRYP